MKKVFILVMFALALGLDAMAQKDFNYEQRRLRDDIVEFLRNEGFGPQIDQDGDIAFKKEGRQYYVQIFEKDKSPMYCLISSHFVYGNTFTKRAVAQAAVEINNNKMVKVVLFDNTYAYISDLYLTSSSAFTSIFYKMIEQIDSAREELNSIIKNN